MDAGGLAQMSPNFTSNGLGQPASGLASRRGGPNVKPLSFEALKSPTDKAGGAPTPRTARGHLLAGLRTAPKTAAASTFPASPTAAPQPQAFGRPANAGYGAQDFYNPPKTAMPHFGAQPGYNSLMQMTHQYTAEQVLAPPEIHIDDHSQEQIDPTLYAQLVATNMYLAQQQQRLQQQLRDVQAAAQQFQGLALNQPLQQQLQQQLQQSLQQQLQQQQRHQQLATAMYGQGQFKGVPQNMASPMGQQSKVYAYIDPTTGQPTYIVDQSGQAGASFADQSHLAQLGAMQQQQQMQQMQQQQSMAAPRLQVSPPPENHVPAFRSNSPPRRNEVAAEPVPLPPPSANAFRRGHKKASSLANANGLSLAINEPPKSAGPKTTAFPMTPMSGSYGPGQGRAGEHPVRQPRGPPSFDELASKPTAKHEGSKNFAARTRRSAIHNLVRAGLVRRQSPGSSGSMSPVSESAEESETPITDNDSESGRSGSGSLSGDMDCSLPSSRTSASGWGAIGSNRPNSRQKSRQSVDSLGSATSACESDNSFAGVFKSAQRAGKAAEAAADQRKTAMLVLTSVEKRKMSPRAGGVGASL